MARSACMNREGARRCLLPALLASALAVGLDAAWAAGPGAELGAPRPVDRPADAGKRWISAPFMLKVFNLRHHRDATVAITNVGAETARVQVNAKPQRGARLEHLKRRACSLEIAPGETVTCPIAPDPRVGGVFLMVSVTIDSTQPVVPGGEVDTSGRVGFDSIDNRPLTWHLLAAGGDGPPPVAVPPSAPPATR